MRSAVRRTTVTVLAATAMAVTGAAPGAAGATVTAETAGVRESTATGPLEPSTPWPYPSCATAQLTSAGMDPHLGLVLVGVTSSCSDYDETHRFGVVVYRANEGTAIALNSRLRPYGPDGPVHTRIHVNPPTPGDAICIIRKLTDRLACVLMVAPEGVISAVVIPVDDPHVSRPAHYPLDQPAGGDPTCGNCVSISI